MRTSLLFAMALAVPCLASTATRAATVAISQRCDYSCLKSACDKVGGIFYGDETRQVCNNTNKGTRVECTRTICEGTTPARIAPGRGTIANVLSGLPVAAR